MKLKKLYSLIANSFAIIFAMIGFILIGKDTQAVHYIKFFTLITNLLIIVSSVLSVGYSVESFIKKDKDDVLPVWAFVLKLITAVGALITFLTVVCYLQHTVYTQPNVSTTLHVNNVMHHYLAPLFFIIGFIGFDIDKKYDWKLAFFGITVLVIYMAYAIPLSNISNAKVVNWWAPNGESQAPYVFMDSKTVGSWLYGLIPVFIIVGLGASFGLWVLNRISYLLFVGDEIRQEDPETNEEKEIEAKVQVTEEDQAAVAEVLKETKATSRVYHISKREDKMWQVKFANGQRAIKLFNTQAEAIVFAKKLAKSQLGSIRIHSLKGRIRKSN